MSKDKNQKPVAKESSNQPVDSRIAAVRDLIFGENMVQYDQDFTEVSNQIQALKKDTDKNLSELATSFQNKLEASENARNQSISKLATDITKRLDQLNDAKADRKKLGKALEKIALMLQG